MRTTEILPSGGVNLAVYRWNSPKPRKAKANPMIVLVHGYPDAASIWNATAEQLAKKYDVVAYDIRGAGLSSCPKNTEGYGLDSLVDDLANVLDAVSPDRGVHLVAHDWGSIQCWEAVTTPRLHGRILSYTSMSGPSLDHAGHWIMRRLRSASLKHWGEVARQIAHSWYIGVFHLPTVAPALWNAAGHKLWPQLLNKVEGISDAQVSPTQVADGLHGINLYRENVFQRVLQPQERRTDIPVQLVFPKKDHFMLPEIWDDLPRWAPNLWRSDVDAGHWLQVSHPEVVVEKVSQFVDFLEAGVETPMLESARMRGRRKTGKHDGKLVVVTGAGSGFGRETALLFAEHGADVVAVDINEDAAKRTAELCRLLHVAAWPKSVDVSDKQQMQDLAKWVGEHFGSADVIVNNAGIGLAGSFFDTSDADWDKVMGVNLGGVILGSRLFGEQMMVAGKPGHIVNVSSMGAFTPSRFMSAYNTSKAAVRMLSDCLRAELASKDIHVSTICPGISITNITRTSTFVGLSPDEQARKQAATTKLYQRRNLQPVAIARAILDAVENKRAEVPVGLEAQSSRWISRLLPALSRQMARLDVAP